MRFVYLAAGFLSLGLGILGIFLPLLPTTPFLLLTAYLFAKSSDRWYNLLLNHKILGPYIHNFRENRAIPLKVKITSVTLLWITILLSTVFATDKMWLRLLLLVIATGVTVHILSYKTLD